ncbi:syntaxin-4 isoform X1 [Chlorocebus sabaeus]|uniref:syntaxin-4 isoform X1 n=1 Tax=Chlorocebus sabaeus TaxID=60711 RepID=UPI003BF99D69
METLQPPQDAEEILSFLGLVGYFRHWIPNFGVLAKPLYQAAKEAPTGLLSDPSLAANSFKKLQDCLLSAPALSLPNPLRPFHLFTEERQKVATGLLAQLVGSTYQAVAYLSKQLDPTVQGWQPCLRALAAATELTKEALKLTLGHSFTVYSSHRLSDLITHKCLSYLTPSWLQQFHLLFIENPHITLTTSTPLNPATLLPTPGCDSAPAYSCLEVLTTLPPAHLGLYKQPLEHPDHTLFVDGSSVLTPDGRRQAAYAVVTATQTVETRPLPLGTTSQKAELTALTRALLLSKGQRVNIYTDSKYAYLIAHTHSLLWQECGFLTTKGMPVVNGPLKKRLLDALQAPKEVAIIHCKSHQHSKDPVSQGNNLADSTARATALTSSPTPHLYSFFPPHIPPTTLPRSFKP